MGLCRQRRNDIVGLKPFEFLARDIKRFCGTAGERHLRPQIFGHGVAVGFILVIQIIAERMAAFVEHYCNMGRGLWPGVAFDIAVQHIAKARDRPDWQPV